MRSVRGQQTQTKGENMSKQAENSLEEQVREHYTQVCHCEWTEDDFTRTTTSVRCAIHGRVPDPLDSLLARLSTAETERDEWEREAVSESRAATNYSARLVDSEEARRRAEARVEALEQARDEAYRVMRQVGAFVAGARCHKQPQFKYEPWDGPCGKCSGCLARAAWYDEDGSPSVVARAALSAGQKEATNG